jgi:hypothetical protein
MVSHPTLLLPPCVAASAQWCASQDRKSASASGCGMVSEVACSVDRSSLEDPRGGNLVGFADFVQRVDQGGFTVGAKR